MATGNIPDLVSTNLASLFSGPKKNHTLENVEKAVGQLVIAYNKQESEIKQLQKSVADAADDNDSLAAEKKLLIEARDKAINKSKQDAIMLATAEAELEGVKKKLAAAEKNAIDEKARADGLANGISDRDVEIAKLNKQIIDDAAAAKKKIDGKQMAINALQKSLGDKDTQITAMTNTKSDDDAEIARLNAEIARLNAAAATIPPPVAAPAVPVAPPTTLPAVTDPDLLKNYAAAELEIKDLKAEVARLKKELDDKTEALKRKNSICSGLTKRIDPLEKELAETKAKLAKAETSLKTYELANKSSRVSDKIGNIYVNDLERTKTEAIDALEKVINKLRLPLLRTARTVDDVTAEYVKAGWKTHVIN